MFLPFLPLIVASTSLTLLAGVLVRPEPWLKMPIWIVLLAILAFSVIVAQLRQNISLFSRDELTLFTEQDKLSSFIKINALAWKLEHSNNSWKFEDVSLLTKMGEFFYFQDHKNKAEIWYRRALKLNPGESRTLNNLAWLLTETHLGDQKRLKESMQLPQKALEGKKTAFIWDTLTEAYFRNGLYEKAADASHNALESAEQGKGISFEADLDYYRKRFKQMAGE